MSQDLSVEKCGEGGATAVTIVSVAAGLMGIGAVMTFSAGATVDRPMLGWEFWKFPALRQMFFVCGGLLALLIMSRVPYRIGVGLCSGFGCGGQWCPSLGSVWSG
ncbi:MAG: hypothetical protein ACYTF1_11370 [Planctomycetota bacterium]|jgi:hypothetical protein